MNIKFLKTIHQGSVILTLKSTTLIINQTLSSIVRLQGVIGLQVFLPKILRFKEISVIGLINDYYRNIIENPIVIHARKMPKKVFLHASFRTGKCSVVFIIISSSSENCLQFDSPTVSSIAYKLLSKPGIFHCSQTDGSMMSYGSAKWFH